MKRILFLLIASGMILTMGNACKGSYGKKVKEPFTGSSYESNKKYFRSVGKGQSEKENIASGKADIDAKREMAGQVNTTIKTVVDQYMTETENLNASDIAEKFQSLAREVMATDLYDLRKIGEKKYHDGKTYTVFIAYEIHKKQMFKFMKQQAKADKRLSEAERKKIEEMIDKQLEQLED
jgi:hypothetical protein